MNTLLLLSLLLLSLLLLSLLLLSLRFFSNIFKVEEVLKLVEDCRLLFSLLRPSSSSPSLMLLLLPLLSLPLLSLLLPLETRD